MPILTDTVSTLDVFWQKYMRPNIMTRENMWLHNMVIETDGDLESYILYLSFINNIFNFNIVIFKRYF